MIKMDFIPQVIALAFERSTAVTRPLARLNRAYGEDDYLQQLMSNQMNVHT